MDNLPVGVTSFVGRRREVAEVKGLLSSSRLVTLTGVGGVGKSRLALAVADQLRRAFVDGVWVVELEALAQPELLNQTVIQAMGVRSASSARTVDALIEFLHDKQTLLLFDNCEHLVHECAALVGTLMRAAPKLRILATSREPLRIAGEQTFAVPPLSVPAPHRALSARASTQYGAMALFMDRARSVLPDFAVTEDNVHVLARVCQRLDGVPLAIELAAVRVRVLSAEEILSRLSDQHGLLTEGDRAALPRHQTLRAAMDWSFDLCSQEERLLWARLSIFAAGFDLDAAEHVCAGNGLAGNAVFQSLAMLIEKSILVREEGTARARYRLLEPVRQYGRERLALSGEEDALRRRHRDYYLHVVERADAEWFGPEQVAWSTCIRDALPNIRAALDFCLTEPGEERTGLRIAGALWFYWIACDYPGEGRHWLDRALGLDTEPSRERAKALWADGYAAVRKGDLASALSTLDECRKLAQKLDDQDVAAAAVEISGLVELLRNNVRDAVPLLQQAVTYHDSVGASTVLAPLALALLALSASLSGDVDRAIALCEQARTICMERGERWELSYALWNLGLAHWIAGDLVEARTITRKAVAIKYELNDLFGIALGIELLAWIAAAETQAERAARLLGASQKHWQPIGKLLYGSRTYLSFHEQCEQRARQALGEQAFQRAVDRGEQFTLDELVAYACAERGIPTQPAATPQAQPLTPREQQIAELVGQGLSNKQIADTLVISQRTAEAHVENILTKLGFNSRVQIATWVGQEEQADKDEPTSRST